MGHYKKKLNNTTRKKLGGEAINHGGYGCIFKPQLICKNSTTRKKKYISKLLLKDPANQELATIIKLQKILKNIPNYKKYFLIGDIDACRPNPLTKKDLINYDKECTTLQKNNITKNNINNNLDLLISINIPDGGIDFDNWISNSPIDIHTIILINTIINDILIHALKPLIQLNFNHFDIKGTNILIDKNNQPKLIDWGLADKHTTNIPITIQNKSPHYNMPFSNILFSDMFNKSYEIFLQINSPVDDQHLTTFIINFYYTYCEIFGFGHRDVIINIFINLFLPSITIHIPQEELTQYFYHNYYLSYLVNYIKPILIKYTSNNKFNAIKYFKEVYAHNCDIWGLIICYEPLLLKLTMHHITKRSSNSTAAAHAAQAAQFINTLHNAIVNIFIEFLFSTPVTKINIQNLSASILNINRLIQKDSIKNTTIHKRCKNKSRWNKKKKQCIKK